MNLPGVVSSWANWVDLRFKYTSALKKIQIYVNGEEKGSKILSKTISATHFLNAPLRFGGNHVDPLDQNLNAEIKNLYISGINEPIGRDWRAVARVSDDSVNDVVNFNVSYKDLAGNEGDNRTRVNSITNSIRIDTVIPELDLVSLASNNPDNSTAMAGDNLTLTVRSRETLHTLDLSLIHI